MPKVSITIRPMQFHDIPAGMRLKEIAGWNQLKADWRLFLQSNPAGCFVAEHQGQVIGTVTSTNYGRTLSWLSMVLVDPAFRRRGIATRLTLKVLETISPGQAVKLDATPVGQQVYEPLGFKAEYDLYRLTNARVTDVTLPKAAVSPLSPSTMTPVYYLDQAAFGADRSVFLSTWAINQPQLAWQILSQGGVTGYCLGRPGANYHQLGPLIAEQTGDAARLASTALKELGEQPVVMDVPAAQSAFLAWLSGLGFRRVRTFRRMVHRQNHHLGQPEKVFAIAGPEFG